jgi:putative ABC transport system permease protein
MSTFLHDLRFAVRVLLKTPGFSVAAVLVLSAAIGVNAAVFSFVNALLIRPMPGRDRPGEVVGLYSRDRTRPDSFRDFSYPTYEDIRERAGVFTDTMAFSLAFAGVREGDATRRTLVSPVTASYFSTLGVGLAAGRVFTPDEERPGAASLVAIVSDEYWQKRGASLSLIGSSLPVNGRPFTIVGVAPRGFTGTAAVIAPEVWVPTGAWEIVADAAAATGRGQTLADRRNEALMVVGRLKPGLTPESVAPALRRLAADLEREFPAEHENQDLLVAALPRLTISSAPQSDRLSMGYSALVMAVAALVLLIAGMNLANMVLARGSARQKEVAMRLALGASRGRIVRQLLTEGFLLSLAGGAGGLVVSYWSSRVVWSSFVSLSPVPMHFDPTPDARTMAVTLGFCVASTLVFGLGPAWRLSRTAVLPQLKAQAGQASSGGRDARWSGRNLLVAGQFALSLGLLTAAGLFVRGAMNVASADPGYGFGDRAVATVDSGLSGVDQARARSAFRRVLERVRAMPDVQSAAASSSIAFGTMIESRPVRRAGARVEGASIDSVVAVVGSGYFGTLGLPMLRGRDFSPAEEQEAGAPRVVIVDQPLSRLLFGGQDPIGRQVAVEGEGVEPWLVVGMAPGLRQSIWDKAPVAHIYLPSGRVYRSLAHIHVRFRPGTAAGEGLQALGRAIRAADDSLPVMALQTLAEHRNTTTTFWAVRMFAKVFSTFGGLALFLAVVGVYAVKAYVVARRTREVGIRMALGSTPAQVMRLVLGEGLALNLAGLGCGLLTAFAIGRLAAALLYDVRAVDPLVFAAAPLVLAAAVLIACYVPVRRATRIAPIAALRME